ncbi:MAG: sigma-70 family RNA polymerase sigma factor [Bernardetiaceae bacterium]|nr:sigma-70 family RNA polymerase sigma factor [Bernardetiaceae bacterium]
MLYKQYYGYAMSVCLRYSNHKEEAAEVLNDSFLKVFNKIHQYDPKKSFRGWLRRILINTSIDYYRRNEKHYYHSDVESAMAEEYDLNVLDKLSAEDIYKIIQKLPEIYRITFNLYEVEGYSHEEISQKLGVPAGTSRSNLSRAKQKLRELVKQHLKVEYEVYLR